MAQSVRFPAQPTPSTDGASGLAVDEPQAHALLTPPRERVLAGVAYELRAPLTLLQNVLEILAADLDELSQAELDQLMRASRRGLARVRRLMEDLATASAIQSGGLKLHPEPVRLTVIVEDALAAAEDADGPQPRRIEHSLPGGAVFVVADRRLATRAVAGLLIRAARYAPADQSVCLRAERLGGWVRITIEDSGRWTLAERHAALLRRPPSASTSGDEPGIDLSLAVARGIANAHGGRLAVETGAGAGGRIWLTFPAPQAAQVPQTSRHATFS